MAAKIIVANSLPIYLYSDTDKWSSLKKRSLWNWTTYWSVFFYVILIIALYWIEDVYCKSGINLSIYSVWFLLFYIFLQSLITHLNRSLLLYEVLCCRLLTFWRNTLLPLSGWKISRTRINTQSNQIRENGVGTLLRYVCELLPDITESQPRR